MNSFLKQTAESIVKQIGWEKLKNTTIVLQTHRAGITLEDEILQLQKNDSSKVTFAPDIMPISDLFDKLSPLYAEDELMTIVRLYRAYLSTFNFQLSTDPLPLDMFYGWGRQMLADFTNIDASMPAEEVKNFFDNVIAAKELEQLEIDDELRARLNQLFGEKEYNVHDSIREQYERLWKKLYELYMTLHAELARDQKGYPGMRQRSVIEHWDDDVQEKISGRTFVFVGFNYLLPVEFELMQRLRDAGQAHFYWDYVADFRTNEKAFSFAELNSGKLGSNTRPQQWTAAKEIDVYSCSSRESQAQYVHQWLIDNYTQEGERAGVVICDESMLEPVIYTLPSITLPGKQEPEMINITKGFPLRNTQIYAEAMRWLNDRENGKAEDTVSPEFIDRLSAYLFPETTEETEATEPTESTPKGMKWQELLQLESNYQVHKIVNQMRKLVADGLGDIPFTLKLVRLLMRRMMESVNMPFHGEPICGIQVMGVLETRMLDFDKLLLLNVEEGVVPQSKADMSFIPYYLRKYYHMQTNDERATVYAYNFFRLISRAGQTTMLFSNIGGVDNSKGMSRFVMQMLASPEFKINKYRLIEPDTLNETKLIDEDKQSLVDALGLVTNDAGKLVYSEDGKEYTLSPSSLNTYITCPLKFYFEKIKHIQEPEKEEAVLANNTLGTLVHNTMQAIYKHLGCNNQEPVEINAADLKKYKDEERLNEMLAEAYEELNADQQKRGKMVTYAMEDYFMDNPKIKQYVINLINNDLRTIEKEGLRIWQLEQWYVADLQVPESDATIRIGGKIDRVDLCGYKTNNERIRIVDYKTSKYDKNKLNAELEDLMDNKDRDYVRQTMIYSYVLKKYLEKRGERSNLPIQPNLFFCASDMEGNNSIVTVKRKVEEKSQIFEFNDIQEESLLIPLQNKVKELLSDTKFPQCDEDKCPNYCAFYELCKRKKNDY